MGGGHRIVMHVDRQNVIERIGTVVAEALNHIAGLLVFHALEPHFVGVVFIVEAFPVADRHAVARVAGSQVGGEVGEVVVNATVFGTPEGAVNGSGNDSFGLDE